MRRTRLIWFALGAAVAGIFSVTAFLWPSSGLDGETTLMIWFTDKTPSEAVISELSNAQLDTLELGPPAVGEELLACGVSELEFVPTMSSHGLPKVGIEWRGLTPSQTTCVETLMKSGEADWFTENRYVAQK